MRRLITLLLVLMMTLSTALAGDPANPADPVMVAKLLPGYTCIEGIDDGDVLRLLMRNAEDELVFVGGILTDNGWHFTESPPCPRAPSWVWRTSPIPSASPAKRTTPA